LDLAKNYLGGLGASIKLAYDLLRPRTDPLSPEDVVAIGVGPMVGTLAPGSSRVCAVTKLPANRAIAGRLTVSPRASRWRSYSIFDSGLTV
jgi:aldehyde:ferredoxin oxidoreductase